MVLQYPSPGVSASAYEPVSVESVSRRLATLTNVDGESRCRSTLLMVLAANGGSRSYCGRTADGLRSRRPVAALSVDVGNAQPNMRVCQMQPWQLAQEWQRYQAANCVVN